MCVDWQSGHSFINISSIHPLIMKRLFLKETEIAYALAKLRWSMSQSDGQERTTIQRTSR